MSDEREPWVITFILSKPQHESSCLGIVSVSLSYSCCALSRKYSCPELIPRNLLGLREAVPLNGRRNFCVHRMNLFKTWLKFEPFQIFKILLITLVVLVLGGGIGEISSLFECFLVKVCIFLQCLNGVE